MVHWINSDRLCRNFYATTLDIIRTTKRCVLEGGQRKGKNKKKNVSFVNTHFVGNTTKAHWIIVVVNGTMANIYVVSIMYRLLHWICQKQKNK